MRCASCNAENPPQARFCTMCGEQLQPAGSRERRRVSVVFIDLTAFTTLTLGFDPEELRDLADEVLTVVAGVIEDFDGYVDAFRGDGLIALFGAPRSHPDDPQRAVMAAAAGLQAIESIGRAKGYPLKGRAGVNTGIVIAGAVGSGRVRDYTVMGSTVNLAARLEAAAIPGEVWVGPETYESTRHRLVYQVSPAIRLAGFPNVRHAYRLVSTLEQYDLDPYAHLDLVGRDGDLAELTARFDRVRERATADQLWLVGEAGSGKTRLLREFTRIVGRDGVRVLWVAGNPGENSARQQLARQILALPEGAEPRVRQQRAQQALQNLLPAEEEWHGLILTSLGLREEGGSSRKRLSERSLAAWRDLLLAWARQDRSGALLAVDSGSHDRWLVALLDRLQEGPAPLLVVRTSRDRDPSRGADVITLPPLDLASSVELLNQLVDPGMRAATESLIKQVGGVPAYIIELGRALSTTGAGSVSGSLVSLLQARLDMLEPKERQTLSLAALTGERSWERQLIELSGDGGEQLKRLISEDLLVTETSSDLPGEVAYRFQSELLRHAVLRMIPFADRPVLHLRIAAWLEQNAPLALSERIGYHFREGGSPEDAYPHYLAAADLAASQNDPRAHELFETLLELELPPALAAQGTLAYSQALLGLGRVEESRQQLQQAEELITGAPAEVRGELEEACRRLHSDLKKTGTESGAR